MSLSQSSSPKNNSVTLVSLLFFQHLFFCGSGILTQCFTLAKNVLYCFSLMSSFFCFGYFGDDILRTICLGCPRTTILLIPASQVARIIVICPISWQFPFPLNIYYSYRLLTFLNMPLKLSHKFYCSGSVCFSQYYTLITVQYLRKGMYSIAIC
jgi:hypothetical protein